MEFIMNKFLLTVSALCLFCTPAYATGSHTTPSDNDTIINNLTQHYNPTLYNTNKSENHNANSNNNANNNVNTAYGGHATSNSNASAQAQGGAGGQGGNSSNSVNVNNQVAASSAIAPSLTSDPDTCMGSTSAGAQGVGFGLSLGSTWKDEECVRRKNARLLYNMGLPNVAVTVMCNNKEVYDAIQNGDAPNHLKALCVYGSGHGEPEYKSNRHVNE